jgi:TPR repeat protein
LKIWRSWVAAAITGAALNKRALRQSGTALVVLAIMTSFLLFQTSVRKHFHSEAASAAMKPESSAPPAASRLVSASISDRKEASTAGPSSHLVITDRTVAEALHELTRYEIATLKRTADYGDTDATFELGMAYETGYYVRQNCTKAAQWVRVAVQEGNAAAEYNLGLRYRHGDGVEIDYAIAEQWLKKAAAQEYFSTKLP